MSPYYYERPRIFYKRLKTPVGRHMKVKRHRLEMDLHRSFTVQSVYRHKAEVFKGWMLYYTYQGTDTMLGRMLGGESTIDQTGDE